MTVLLTIGFRVKFRRNPTSLSKEMCSGAVEFPRCELVRGEPSQSISPIEKSIIRM